MALLNLFNLDLKLSYITFGSWGSFVPNINLTGLPKKGQNIFSWPPASNSWSIVAPPTIIPTPPATVVQPAFQQNSSCANCDAYLFYGEFSTSNSSGFLIHFLVE